MKNLYSLIFLISFPFSVLFSQSTLFDESRVSSVYIEIPPDSLKVIITDVLSEHYFMARFIYDYGTGRDTLRNVGFRLRGNIRGIQKRNHSRSVLTNMFPAGNTRELRKLTSTGSTTIQL
jgi:hypothetical protein